MGSLNDLQLNLIRAYQDEQDYGSQSLSILKFISRQWVEIGIKGVSIRGLEEMAVVLPPSLGASLIAMPIGICLILQDHC